MKLTFLGTGSMVPSKDRNVQGLYLDIQGEGILLDCGEGTQRQIIHAGLNAQKIKKILISHWHGDHVIGLPGLLQTLGNFGNEDKKITLYGPTGSATFIEHMKQSSFADGYVDLDIVELDPKGVETFYEHDDYYLQAATLEHGVPCLGFRVVKKEKHKVDMKKLNELGVPQGPHLATLQEGSDLEYNGQTIKASEVTTKIEEEAAAFIFDTKITDHCYALAQDAKLLVSESVYTSAFEDKAEEYKHLTAKQVAHIASQCGVEQLILTHFSQRFKTTDELEEDAKQLFANVVCAYDFYSIEF